uniref:Lipid-binding serum glycoprotein N-terminal domain-containing protein n=1 Tax=Moschus moschiferus TaxID=68415 RepID=A0A8C6FMR8_MOSMO
MFQLWKLVLLCGLLAGTSASLLDNLGKNVLRKPNSGLERGLDAFDDTLETVFQNLKTELESRCSEEVVQETQHTENLLERLISRIFQVVNRLTGVRIRNVQVPDITFEATSENTADVKIPITADITVNRLGISFNADTSLEVHIEVQVDNLTQQRPAGNKIHSDQRWRSLFMLRFGLLSDVVDIGVDIARRVVSSAVQDELCPRIRELLESLDAECVKKLIGKSQPGEHQDPGGSSSRK